MADKPEISVRSCFQIVIWIEDKLDLTSLLHVTFST